MTRQFPHAGRRITIEPALVTESAAFRVEYPSVRNIELVNRGVLRAMEESWGKSIFPEHKLEVFRIHGAYFSEECLILDDELRVIENASDGYTDQEVQRVIVRICDLLQAKLLPHYRGPAVVAKRRAAGNYGHFMMEMLPMGIIGHAYCKDGPETLILLHRSPPPMLDAALRAYRLLGAPLNRLIILGELEPLHVEELVIVRGLTKHGTYMSPLCVATVAALGDHIVPGPHKKIIVRRLPGWQRGRTLINEDELCARLAQQGYQAIEPGSMSLEEQIAAFSGADYVVGAAGAALTNIVFCKPTTRVTSLVPAHFPDTFFWFIATHKRLAYSEIRCDVPDRGDLDQKADFRIRESDIQWLEELPVTPTSHQSAEGVMIIASIQGMGDLNGRLGEWIGTPGSRRPIDGFSIGPLSDGRPIEYRAVVGPNWLSSWMRDGKFCGSRGWNLPLFGIGVRVPVGYESLTSATFTDGTRVADVVGDGTCSASSGAPLEAFHVIVRPTNQ